MDAMGLFLSLLELNVGGKGGVKYDGFRSFGSGVILGEVMNCEGAWAFPRSVNEIMKEEPLLC